MPRLRGRFIGACYRMRALAFDVYGTLVDVHAIKADAAPFLGDRTSAFVARWREKTVEYAFRRGLMQSYLPFGECSRQALDFVDLEMQTKLAPQNKKALLDAHQRLPPFPDVAPALARLQQSNDELLAFSNGTVQSVENTLAAAGLTSYLSRIISVDEVRTFKPSPAVYAFLTRSVAVGANTVWLVSSNAWDVIGAKAAGLRAIWVRRRPEQLFDPWGIEPDATVTSLQECADFFRRTE